MQYIAGEEATSVVRCPPGIHSVEWAFGRTQLPDPDKTLAEDVPSEVPGNGGIAHSTLKPVRQGSIETHDLEKRVQLHGFRRKPINRLDVPDGPLISAPTSCDFGARRRGGHAATNKAKNLPLSNRSKQRGEFDGVGRFPVGDVENIAWIQGRGADRHSITRIGVKAAEIQLAAHRLTSP